MLKKKKKVALETIWTSMSKYMNFVGNITPRNMNSLVIIEH